MSIIINKKLLFLIFIAFNLSLFGQKDIKLLDLNIEPISELAISKLGDSQIAAKEYKVFKMDIANISSQLNNIASITDPYKGSSSQLQLPHPDGSLKVYDIKRNTTLSSELDMKYPDIHMFDGYGVNHSAKVKWSVTPKGLHAMIMQPNEPTIYIDPFNAENKNYYIVYSKKEFLTDKEVYCLFDSGSATKTIESATNNLKTYVSCELRTYRLALAATVEYTDFHGGTKADAQAAQAVTMNRVNGIYERDLAVTMTIIPDNDLIVYEGDANADPYSNGDPGAMITENQNNTDNVIGNANYDIGHVFGTNSGGLAGLGVVCNNGSKAYGVTGSGAPIGDPFDVDYVAHEVGHQFGANHTQNNGCNRNNATAMEPGSASTILGYAGICAPNVQNNSDDHFHGISLEEMGNYIATTTCAVTTAIPNDAPAITGTNANVTVPAGTPFSLTAFATDPDGDILSYCWEQMDNEISNQPPESTAIEGPNFRSNSPVNNPTRYFPNLTDLANGGPYTWEVVPTVSRTMNFRVTVRDQPLGVAGCTDYVDVTVSTDENSGPFVVQYPSATGIVWDALTQETVLWDVANTDLAPISCTEVDILLSTDGGLTYPTVLATDVPNSGSAVINVPNVATTTARIMVVSAAGTFFDVSDNDFEILESTFDFTLAVNPKELTVCQPDDAVFTVDIGEVGGFSDPVSLEVTGVPAGATANFSEDPVTPVGSSDLTISNTGGAASGTYVLTISGTSSTGTKTEDVTLTISNANPLAVTLQSPLNGATGVDIPTDFIWDAASETGVTYEIQISTDPNFGTLVDQEAGLVTESYTSTILDSGVEYYWRVRYNAFCAQSDWSDVFSFITSSCIVYQSADVPVAIPNAGTVTSILNVPNGGIIDGIRVTNLQGIHGRIPHLTFSLTSPTGTTVILMDQVCNNNTQDFDIAFDDDAASAIIPCPPTDGNFYQPLGTLADFIGEDQAGDWTLTITDNQNPIGGELQAWAIELCVVPPTTCIDPDVPTITADSEICEGQSIDLAIINGNLNDAADWEWYTGSCGDVNIASGSIVNVTPSVTTTYFVRGEGGCVTPGACAEVTITVNPTYNETDAAEICEGDTYTFGTQTLTNAGTYTEVFSSVAGCDSTVVLTLAVNPTYDETDAAEICEGDTYTFGTQTLTNAGTYTEVFTSVAGCDSTVVLTLDVNPTYDETDAAEICEGDSYIFGTQTLTNTGTYTEVFTSVAGCDSTVVLTLAVNPTYDETDAATICSGQSYVFGTQTLTTGGTYTEVFTSIEGCDSTVVLTLTEVTEYNETDEASICEGDSYTFGTQTLTNAGTYTEQFSSVSGCDSTVTLTLVVYPTYNETAVAEICEGDSYTFGTQTLTNAGTYTEQFSSVSGCDSTVTLTLEVYPTYNETAVAEICEGDSYTFGTQTLTNAGTYTEQFSSVSGCDSTVTLTLEVIEIDLNVTVNEGTLSADQMNASYQWIDCDNGNSLINGATAQSFTPESSGSYAVVISLASCSDTSACTLVDNVGISTEEALRVLIFPNPTKEMVNIESSFKIKGIEVLDAIGRKVLTIDSINNEKMALDFSHLESGVYIIRISGAATTFIHEIVKQ